MDEATIHIKIEQLETTIKHLEEVYGKDHEETMKQRFQLNELYKKLGNGWSGKVQDGIECLKDRVNDIEKTYIRVENKLNTLVEAVDELKNRPRNKLLQIKDIAYLAVASISIYGFFFT